MNQIPDSALIANENSALILLEVSRPDIVFFQALFESYEGLGAVRTMDSELSLIAILTTPDMMNSVLEVLNSLSDVKWRFATSLEEHRKTEFLNQL